jgi:hypothetical protein
VTAPLKVWSALALVIAFRAMMDKAWENVDGFRHLYRPLPEEFLTGGVKIINILPMEEREKNIQWIMQ